MNSLQHDDKIKITSKKFVWKIVSYLDAKIIHTTDLFDLYLLHDDGSETLVENRKDIDSHAENGGEFGIKVGKLTI